MKITVTQDPNVTEPEITIICRSMDSEFVQAIAYLSLIGNTVTGNRDGETFFIPLSDVLYFETVERRVFFYTADASYETNTKLYQLEEKLSDTSFARISKSFIANLKKIRSLKPEGNSKLCATLINGERLIVSRAYLYDIKRKLGV